VKQSSFDYVSVYFVHTTWICYSKYVSSVYALHPDQKWC